METYSSESGYHVANGNECYLGGKSYLASVWLVSSCIRFSDIRAIVARKTLKSLKEST